MRGKNKREKGEEGKIRGRREKRGKNKREKGGEG